MSNENEIKALRRRVYLLELQVKSLNTLEWLRYLKRCNSDKAGGVERELDELRRQIAELSAEMEKEER